MTAGQRDTFLKFIRLFQAFGEDLVEILERTLWRAGNGPGQTRAHDPGFTGTLDQEASILPNRKLAPVAILVGIAGSRKALRY